MRLADGRPAEDRLVVFTELDGIAPFRYAVLYNDSPASPDNPLIAIWDCGSPITLQLQGDP